MGASTLYDPVLVRHARGPLHRGPLADACSASGVNRPCGDRLSVHVRVDGGQLAVNFEGEGCALAIGAASALCEAAAALDPAAARALAERFRDALEQPPEVVIAPETLGGDLSHFLAVRAFPARRSCVHLAPQVLLDALAALAP